MPSLFFFIWFHVTLFEDVIPVLVRLREIVSFKQAGVATQVTSFEEITDGTYGRSVALVYIGIEWSDPSGVVGPVCIMQQLDAAPVTVSPIHFACDGTAVVGDEHEARGGRVGGGECLLLGRFRTRAKRGVR